jgi:hypothetical protein
MPFLGVTLFRTDPPTNPARAAPKLHPRLGVPFPPVTHFINHLTDLVIKTILP